MSLKDIIDFFQNCHTMDKPTYKWHKHETVEKHDSKEEKQENDAAK